MPMENIPSVLEHGILSHERAAKLGHRSVAMQIVQDRRETKIVPRGLRLHQYANLYFHARNPMLFRVLGNAATLCVFAISTEVLNGDDVVLTDCNAASSYVRFLHPSQWPLIDFDDVLAMDWRHPNNPQRYHQHKSRKCAEVLVPHRVPPELIVEARVIDPAAAKCLAALAPELRIKVDPVLFFRT